jgi:magnesium transporter
MKARGERAWRVLRHGFVQRYAGEAARLLETLPVAETVRLLQVETTAEGARLLERLTPDVAAAVLGQIDEAAATGLLVALEPTRAALLLARLDTQDSERLLARLPATTARELRALMRYPDDSAGHLMDSRIITMRPETTAGQALARIRGLRGARVDDIPLVDGDGRLVGLAALQDIAVADAAERLDGLARPVLAAVHAMATREEVVEELSRRQLRSLPVVDFEGRLLGMLRYDALVKAVEEEATADIQTMVGASKEERALSRPSFAVRKRLPWLEINLVTAFLAAAVVGIFEDTIARFTALAVLLPVVAGQSGNTGAQALAVTMRGLALREIRLRHWWRVSLKEVTVAVVNGLAVALTTAAGVYVWSRSIGLALVIGTSMVISMTAAGLAGAGVPMALSAAGQDPAQSSSIILTTVTDVVGFFSFLGIATLLAAML